jgi:hypothetical protein
MFTKQNGGIAAVVGFILMLLGWLFNGRSFDHPLAWLGTALLIVGIGVAVGKVQRWIEVGVWLVSIGAAWFLLSFQSNSIPERIAGVLIALVGAVLYLIFRNQGATSAKR